MQLGHDVDIPTNAQLDKISLKYVGKFESISVYESSALGSGYGSGGITLPGFGITVGQGAFTQMSRKDTWNLLAHEFGHVLQSLLPYVGADGFYGIIAPQSLASATINPQGHDYFWTETWANYLSNNYFGSSWNYDAFPVKNISWGNLLIFLDWRLAHPMILPALYP